MPLNPDDLADVIADAIKAATAPLLARISTLETKGLAASVVVEKGEPGRDGKDAEVDIDALALKVAALIPAPKDGRDGLDGKDGAPGQDGQVGPAGVDGVAGKDGRDGIDGKDGAAGLMGEKGMDGLAGRDGQPGVPGVAGRDGIDGKDGAVGPMGQKGLDGKDGRDGTLENILPVLNERTLSFRYKGTDEPVEGWALKLPMLIDRGVYSSEKSYEAGDVTSYGGSGWICKQDCHGKQPGTDAGADFWRLAVKRGNDGKPGAKGLDGKDGKPGPAGRDGTRSY